MEGKKIVDVLKYYPPALIAGLVFALEMIINIPDLPEIWGLPISGWIIFILLIIQIVVLQIHITAITNTHPNITPDPDGFDKLESPFPLRSSSDKSDFLIKRYHLVLRNKRIKGITTIDSDPVHAQVYFYDMECKELRALSHEKPFWFNWKPRVQRKLPDDQNIVIKASSEPVGLCLVMRKGTEKHLYVFNDDSYEPGTSNIVFNDSQKITLECVYIRVDLFCGNYDFEPTWILLTNIGENAAPKFELIDKPCKESVIKG